MADTIKKMVIVGGGFAGVTLALNLERKLSPEWDIYLLSKTNFITYNPLLPEVIGASVLPDHVQAPFRLILKRTRIRMVTVDRIDFQKRFIYYHNNIPGSLDFDQLVITAGVQANDSMLPGLAQHTLLLKTVGDALAIRNRVIERLEQATIHPDEERRRELCTFIVMGGGFSGVETAGELDDFLKSAHRYYKNVHRRDCRIVVIHGTDRLLPELSEKLGAKVLENFRKRGIEVMLNERVKVVEEETVLLNSGLQVSGATIICTIGSQSHRLIQEDHDLPKERGKIVTQDDMSVNGVTGVWAIGDCALVMNAENAQICPPTAQFAHQQARVLARNIIARINGKPTSPFSYKPVGMLASIGHNKAVAEIFGMHFSGLIAFMMWRGIYLMKIPTFSRKVRLFLEWNWTMCFPPDITHLGYKRSGEE